MHIDGCLLEGKLNYEESQKKRARNSSYSASKRRQQEKPSRRVKEIQNERKELQGRDVSKGNNGYAVGHLKGVIIKIMSGVTGGMGRNWILPGKMFLRSSME